MPLRLPVAAFAAALFAAAANMVTPPMCGAADLITEAEARQQGLTRVWFSQVQIDARRHRIEQVTLAGEQLLVLTTSGTLQAFDAETGRTMWTTRVGDPRYQSIGPAVGDGIVAVVNGRSVFIFDRNDGRELKNFKAGGAVAAGPAVLDGYVYIPLFNGRLEAHPIAANESTPWFYTSSGRLFHSPTSASESVAWINDMGFLYGGNAASRGVRYYVESGSPFAAAPTAFGKSVYAATFNGDVIAIEEQRGRRTWRYAAGDTVHNPPVALGDELYVTTDEPALHALNRETGRVNWITGGVDQFVSASQDRVYGLDRFGSLLVMDRKTGAPLSRISSRGDHAPVLNQQTDRLYVYSQSGLLQCFHEIGADKPFYHRPLPKPQTTEADKPEATEQPAPEPANETPAEDPFGGGGTDPFGGGGDGGNDPFGGGGDDDPFGGGGEDPFGGEGADDDPFG